MPTDYIPGDGIQIQFTIGEVTNPVSVQEVDGLKIVIYAKGKYAVDEFEGPIGWEMTHGNFASAMVVPNSFVSYAENTDYYITFTPEHKITQNGYIEI